MRATLAALTLALLGRSVLAADPVDYRRDVKPILTKHCIACHGPEKQRSGLRVDTAKFLAKGGNSGSVIAPGKSAASKLIHAVNGSNDVAVMPPKGPGLTDKEKLLLARWIDDGAKAPADEVVETGTTKSKHWAFQPIKRPSVPQIRNPKSEIRNPIDRFILAKLQDAKIEASPEADRGTLLRRVCLDLTGLPPTPAEIDAALNDTSPDWYERLVDRLLASPHFGERWGRHWLDAARYADSNGFTIDGARVIWPYRDYVLQAINRDMPFDQFAIEQLAGDLLPNPTREQLVATGFHRNTLFNQEGGVDQEQFRIEYVTDRVNTTGTVFLGLTVGCAACHDHKFDPLSQREYYQFFAFFNSCDEPTLELPTAEQEQQKKSIQTRLAELEKLRKHLDRTSSDGQLKWETALTIQAKDMLSPDIQRILDLAPNSRDKKQQDMVRETYRTSDAVKHLAGMFTPGHPLLPLAQAEIYFFRLSVEKRVADLKKTLPDIPTTLILRERKTPRPTHVLLGGDFTRKGTAVDTGTPNVLPPLPKPQAANRLELARWIVDPKNPLTARVMVNRFWQQYFGVGLVETENDFGTQGTPPTHPELLDWLASEFIGEAMGEANRLRKLPGERAWSMKHIHRLIVTSATYRQSSKARSDLSIIDPRNRLLSRQNRLRLDAEVVRDNALAVSGLLERRLGGPSVFPPQPDGVYAFTQLEKSWKAATGPDRFRRGLYTYFWRSAPHPGLMAFDSPDGNTTCTRRLRSNTPLQALTLLNDQAYFELAQELASRCLRETNNQTARITHLYRLCLGRAPLDRERRIIERLLTRSISEEKTAWTAVARVLLNLDEFITRE